jgi:O-antigen/teichoic acid export membrane protein
VRASQPIRSNVRWLLLANLLVKPVWFVFLLASARRLGAGEFGLAMLALSFTSLLMVILEGGVDMHVVRALSGHPDRYAALVAKSGTLKVASGLLVALLALVLSGIDHVVPFARALLFPALTFTLFNAVMLHARSVFRGFEIMRFEAASIVVEKVAVILLCGAVLLLRRDAVSFLNAYAVAYAVACVFTVALLVKNVGVPRGSVAFRSLWTDVLRPALPFALMSVFMIVYFRSATLILSYVTGQETLVGYFNAGYRLVEAYILFPSIVMAPIYPVLSRRAKEGRALSPLLVQALRAVLVMALLVTLPLVTFSAGFTNLLYGASFAPAREAIAIVALTMIPVSLTYVFGTLVAASGRQTRANPFILLITLINVAANLALIPLWGVAGAAAVTVGTETLIAGASLWIARDFMNWKDLGSLAGRLTGVSIAAVLLAKVGLKALAFPLGPIAMAVMLLAGFAALRVITVRDVRLLTGWRTGTVPAA